MMRELTRSARPAEPGEGLTPMLFTQYYLDCLSQASYLVAREV